MQWCFMRVLGQRGSVSCQGSLWMGRFNRAFLLFSMSDYNCFLLLERRMMDDGGWGRIRGWSSVHREKRMLLSWLGRWRWWCQFQSHLWLRVALSRCDNLSLTRVVKRALVVRGSHSSQFSDCRFGGCFLSSSIPHL